MNNAIRQHIQSTLRHLYISPLEACNLHCAMCYTKKTTAVLSKDRIVRFIDGYQKVQPLDSITFCGGEVFLLPWFTSLINILTTHRSPPTTHRQSLTTHHSPLTTHHSPLLIQIITNGTIDRLDEFKHPNSVNLIVSLDGLRAYHDTNRGRGMFTKSVKFLQKAFQMGFHTEIFSIITRENFPQIKEFESYVRKAIDPEIRITYHPRKPMGYLNDHPVSNVVGETNGFGFLTEEELKKLFQLSPVQKVFHTFPPRNLGCYQLSVMSDGNIYGCCEGIRPIGSIDDPIDQLISTFKTKILEWDPTHFPKGCLGCVEGGFTCGFRNVISCR